MADDTASSKGTVRSDARTRRMEALAELIGFPTDREGLREVLADPDRLRTYFSKITTAMILRSYAIEYRRRLNR